MRQDQLVLKAAIASRVRRTRLERGFSQADVAIRLGLHRPAVSEIEAARRSISAEELVVLARLFGVGVSTLVDIPDLPSGEQT